MKVTLVPVALKGTSLPEIAHTGDDIGSPLGCARFASNGVIPGQWGNWSQSRAFWCPGMEVVPWVVDITDDVTVGSENEISYLGLMDGEIWQPDSTGANVRMQSYLVYYE